MITLMGMISVAVFNSLDTLNEKNRLIRQQQAVLRMMQEARSLALGNLVEGETAVTYYKIVVNANDYQLLRGSQAADGTAAEETLNDEDFNDEATATVTDPFEFWYFAPDSQLCWDALCADTTSEKTLTLESKYAHFSASIVLHREGGYPDPIDPTPVVTP